MEINETIRKLRKDRGFTQETFAAKLNIARETYTKIENGSTTLTYPMLINISKALGVPVSEIIKGGGDPVFNDISEELAWMLFEARESVMNAFASVIPYEKLEERHLKFLAEKGFIGKEAYEENLMGGRIYDCGPRRWFEYMVENLGMDVLFKRELIQDEFWLYLWKRYKESPSTYSKEYSEIEIDEQDYFDVYTLRYFFPGNKDAYYQLARKDFPEGMDAWQAMEYWRDKLGAYKGDVVSICHDYCPVGEILPPSENQ